MRWADWLLGRGQGRGAVKLTLLALAVYALFAVNVAVQVHLGLMQAGPGAWVSGLSLAGITAFYLLLRTGLSQQLGGDPSLTLPQSVFGVLITAWGYAIDPALRGAIIAIMLLNLVWGMFVLSQRQAFGLYLFGLAALGAAMAWGAATDPVRFPPAVEALHFSFAAILMTAVSVLSVNMARLRAKLGARTADLHAALERIQYLAHHDELTRISNRRHLSERLAAEQLNQRQSGQTMSLVLIDIDHFKAVNDLHGHAAGDAVLRHFATALQSALRSTDFAGRWGGEEFLVVTPQASADTAAALVDRLRAALAVTSFDSLVPGLRITFSAGVAECAPGEDLHLAIDRADRALYRAKLAGRDRTVSEFAPL
ncbi:GGDEF domain-containing protein [Roseateles saccharophilus]|uniref:diguanylate cyclase n=1 Tax=Roseateles saccharophilus TaxID=304 RepID=A0A4R3UMP4_ROSSA|nr:diguanylate cyclase (GGDEF)-like protein [Roseateles saccharophilus]